MQFLKIIEHISSTINLGDEKNSKIIDYIKAQEELLKSKKVNEGMLTSLMNSINDEEKTIEDIRVLIDNWINKNFDEKELRKLHGKISSLAELIQAQDSRWEFEWGCASDFQHVITVNSFLFNRKQHKVCSPASIISENSTIESHGVALKSCIEDNLEKEESVTILIPLNDGQKHWLLGIVTIADGKIRHAELWNSMHAHSAQAFNQFRQIMSELGFSESIPTNADIQNDGYRCFDYVCQKILTYSRKSEDDDIINADSGAVLRKVIAEKIAGKLGCQLIHDDLMTPVTKQLSHLAINKPEHIEGFNAELLLLLQKYSPAAADEYEKSGVLVIEKAMKKITLSCSDKKSKVEQLDGVNSNQISPKKLDNQFKMAARNKNPQLNFSEETRAKLEHNFRTYYDDSSDSESEADLEGEKINVEKYKSNVAKGSDKYRKYDYWKISFYLHVLGMMLLKSNAVNKIYNSYKTKHLSLGEGAFLLLKNKVYAAFQEQKLSEQVNYEDFEEIIWPLFMEKFRNFSKRKKSLDSILEKTLKEVLMTLFDKKNLGADKEIILQGLVDKVKFSLPKRMATFSEEIIIASNGNSDHQIMAIIRFLYRLTRRNAKNFVDGTPNSTFKIMFISTKMSEKFHLTTQKDGNCIRRDEVDLGFKGTSYPALLSSRTKKGVMHFPSIAKYTSPHISKSHRKFTDEMYAASHGESFKDKSYHDFLRKFYYLLQRGESGRNPANLIINIMLFRLVEDRQYQWDQILPANDEQKNMFASNIHPTLIHPMTFKEAPKAAAVLIEDFDDVIDPSLQYYPHQDTAKYDSELNAAHVIAHKQYNIVNAWFTHFKRKAIDHTSNEKIIESLCKLANSYYFD